MDGWHSRYRSAKHPLTIRATVLVEEEELTISEFHYGAGERGAQRHVHREHADAFLVLDGEFTFHLRVESLTLPAGISVCDASPPVASSSPMRYSLVTATVVAA